MNKPLFTGACTALVTPFLGGQVNYPMMEQLLTRQIEAGITAVVLAGTTGESPTLSDEEKLELFRRAKAFAGDACQIIAGTGSRCFAGGFPILQQSHAGWPGSPLSGHCPGC